MVFRATLVGQWLDCWCVFLPTAAAGTGESTTADDCVHGPATGHAGLRIIFKPFCKNKQVATSKYVGRQFVRSSSHTRRPGCGAPRL